MKLAAWFTLRLSVAITCVAVGLAGFTLKELLVAVMVPVPTAMVAVSASPVCALPMERLLKVARPVAEVVALVPLRVPAAAVMVTGAPGSAMAEPLSFNCTDGAGEMAAPATVFEGWMVKPSV